MAQKAATRKNIDGPQKDPALLRTSREPPVIPESFPDIAAWAAWLYFVDEMTQSDVAKTIGVSRVTVIKLLNEAKQKGLVTVQVNPPLMARVDSARALAECFGLASAFVIPENPQRPLVDRLGDAGASLLLNDLKQGDVIGVAWGRTVLAAVSSLRLDAPIPGLTVVQVSASPNGLSSDFSPELCVLLCANNLGARSVSLLAPAILSTPDLKEMMLKEPTIRTQMDVIRSANKVVFGVGELTAEATLRTSGLYSTAGVDDMIKAGAVAAILGRFVAPDGKEMIGPTHDRMLGLTLDELRAIPKRICLAGGRQKTAAILAALRGGLVTDLVTDLETAKILMKEAAT